MELGDKFRLVLATTLREDGFPDSGDWNPIDTGPSRADSFEYVMHGKIYRIEGDDNANEGMDNFTAKVNLEVQWADEQSIAAVERAGGRITCAYYDLHSVIALADPEKFFKSGAPIPRRLTPPGNIMEFYVTAKNRGYLADPKEVAEERLILSQKYGYELVDNDDEFLKESKDPRQIFYGLHPGWVVNLADKVIYKPADPDLVEMYKN